MECAHIPELSYSDFGRRLKERTAGRRVPLSGSMELTFQCNLRCKHCYLDGVHNGIDGQQELTTVEWYDLLDQMAAQGTLWLLMTGGEPFVRPDFLDIYTYAKRKGFLVTIFTNGTPITPEIADYLAQLPPRKIEITLYGYSQATYELVTGIPGSHARCLRGIELLLERGLPLELKTVVNTLNQHEFHQMRAFAEARNVRFRHDASLVGAVDGNLAPLALRLSPTEIVAFEDWDAEQIEHMRELWQTGHDHLQQDPHGYLYRCGAGIGTYHIDPYGRMNVCLLSRKPGYELRSGSLETGWKVALVEERRRLAAPADACTGCSLQVLCHQCPGAAGLEGESHTQPVEFRCELGSLRAKVLGLADAKPHGATLSNNEHCLSRSHT